MSLYAMLTFQHINSPLGLPGNHLSKRLRPAQFQRKPWGIVCSLPRPCLIFVTPNGFCRDQKIAISLAKDALIGGVSLIQIRDRYAGKEDILATTEALLLADVPPRRLSVNGLPSEEISKISEQIGIHVREADISKYLENARCNLSSDATVSCSVHSRRSALQVMNQGKLSYIQVGTMFPTQSHPGKVPEGPRLLVDIRDAVGPSQVLVAIGGINMQNLRKIFEHGADGVAVISSISSALNPCQAASDLIEASRYEWEALK